MTRVALLASLLLLTSGCALFTRDATRALADADAYAAHGDYTVALAAYDAYLTRYPEDDGVPRARAVRTLMAEVVALRAEIAALRAAESTRAPELARLRQELSARQAEAARLREDLEALKRTDLQMERRRR